MLEKLTDNAELIDLAVAIWMRQATTLDRAQTAYDLAAFARFAVNWRVLLSSETQAGHLYDNIADNPDLDLDQLNSAVDEFVFRTAGAGVVVPMNSNATSKPMEAAAASLVWPSRSDSIPEEALNFVASEADYLIVIRKNVWAFFLYLLSMSDIIAIMQQRFPQTGSQPLKGKVGPDAAASTRPT